MGWSEQPRQDNSIFYRHDEPNHRVHRVLQSSELGPPTLTRRPVCPHPFVSREGGGGHTRLRERGWGPNSEQWTSTVVLKVYMYLVSPTNQPRKDPFHLYSLSLHSPQFQQSAGATPLYSTSDPNPLPLPSLRIMETGVQEKRKVEADANAIRLRKLPILSKVL
jgi:hypothetical protein